MEYSSIKTYSVEIISLYTITFTVIGNGIVYV